MMRSFVVLFSILSLLGACSKSAGDLRVGTAGPSKLEDDRDTDTGGGTDDRDTDLGDDEVIALAWDDVDLNAKNWTKFTRKAILKEGRELLSTPVEDMDAFCPNYPNLNRNGRVMFWVALIAGMTKNESAFDPSSFEVITEPRGSVVKRGLTRIDIDRAGVHECNVTKGGDLHVPETNLTCAVRILNYWIFNEKAISKKAVAGDWRGASRVWPSLQNSGTLDDIVEITTTSDVCF